MGMRNNPIVMFSQYENSRDASGFHLLNALKNISRGRSGKLNRKAVVELTSKLNTVHLREPCLKRAQDYKAVMSPLAKVGESR